MWPPTVSRRCGEAEEQIRANEERRQGAREGDGQKAVHPHHRQVAEQPNSSTHTRVLYLKQTGHRMALIVVLISDLLWDVVTVNNFS